MLKSQALTAPAQDLFYSRQDPKDPRLGELAAAPQAEVAILGYPDDEGIRLNFGREGARHGPTEIRRALYRMTPHLTRRAKTFCDVGDLKPEGTLEARQQTASNLVSQLLKQSMHVLTLGGGNDYAFPDGAAFLEHFPERPLIINVDAHLDVRDTARGPHSGTPFFRLLEGKVSFDFVEFGIQSQCNARTHLDYVKTRGGHIVTLDEVIASGLSLHEVMMQRLGDLVVRRRPTFIAIDMDAFTACSAPGTSASWPLGLDPLQFWPVLLTWLKRLDVRVLGIYETSPPLDPSGVTAKLAAQWAHTFLHHV